MIFLTLTPRVMYATILEVTEQNSQYGTDKKSRVQLEDGEMKTVYTKPAVKDVYDALRPGLRVELKPKNSGAGYLIQKVIGEAKMDMGNGQYAPAAPNGQAPEGRSWAPPKQMKAGPQAIADYIKTSAGQYAYCVKMLQEKFQEAGVVDITDDLLKAGATSIFIATKDKFH